MNREGALAPVVVNQITIPMFTTTWKWSAVKTKQIEALINKVMRIEGVLPPSDEEKVVA